MLEHNKIYNMDCLEGMKQLDDNSVDAIVTDPPYGISFMGKKWDYDVPSIEIWKECLRVLKPGGYLLCFAGTRTQHRMAIRIEDAGFEIRDMIAWVYGSGFPKSLDIGKAIDKLQGNERETIGVSEGKGYSSQQEKNKAEGFRPYTQGLPYERADRTLTRGNTEWEGWGTALKPALEPITVARKPLNEKSVAENVLKWGTGGINIDESRVGIDEIKTFGEPDGTGNSLEWSKYKSPDDFQGQTHQGRFPSNFIHDGSDEVVALFPQSETTPNYNYSWDNTECDSNTFNGRGKYTPRQDSGSASRFFYCAKASSSERNECLDEMEEVEENLQGLDTRGRTLLREDGSETLVNRWKGKPTKNFHPTVKPVALMTYLIKLVSKDGALILDPFIGSGTTAYACKYNQRKFIGFEIDKEYCRIANKRLSQALIGEFDASI